MCLSVCMPVCLCIVSIQCQSLLPISPVPAHPTTTTTTTSTLPAPRCPSPPLPLLLAMASVPPPVASSRLRLPLSSSSSSSASRPLPVLATRPERCPHASASRSTSSYWGEASHCLQEPSALSPSPLPPLPPPRPHHLTVHLLQLPAALPQILPHPLWANATQVCVNIVRKLAWNGFLSFYLCFVVDVCANSWKHSTFVSMCAC